ncbi:hypothetical protein [Fulvivirga lutea]|uniref:Uncharacterized protein n=1 Tax=Fulvivirga lutea TaxID=2810512 RepID=A0A975A0M7_9BACT|nr:hypothetical protein [Fulvivirga lutea]QSE97360.1 hypothetical protein JR347_17520 [Fulvivirga lutea]
MKLRNREIFLILLGLITLGVIIYQASKTEEAQNFKEGFKEGYEENSN